MRESHGSPRTERDQTGSTDKSDGLPRRRFLQTSAAAVSAAGLGLTTSGAATAQMGSVPRYADFLPADDRFRAESDDVVEILALDMSSYLEVLQVSNENQQDDDQQNDEPTPFQLEPLTVSFLSAIFSLQTIDQLGLSVPLLGQSFSAQNPENIDTNTPTDRYIAFGNTAVFTGSFDTDAIASAVEQSDLTESDTPGVYTGSTQFGTEIAVAWNSGAFISARTPELVMLIAEAGRGEQTRWYERESDFGRLLAEGGQGEFTYTRFAPGSQIEVGEQSTNIDYSVIRNAPVQGYAQSNSFDLDSGVANATSVFSHASESDINEEVLRSVASDATESSFSRSGRFVTVEASYQNDQLQDDSGTEDSDGTDGTDGSDETDGTDGSDGTDDMDGSDGTDGMDGSDGTDGMDGSDGTDGMDGSDGTDGMDGSDGTDGMDGSDGTDSMDGSDGMDSTDGSDSSDGTDGSDGSDESDGSDGSESEDGGDGESESSDGTGPGFGVVSAATGIGGAGYLIKQHLDIDGDGE